MSNIVPINSKLPASLQALVGDGGIPDDLSAGIKSSFGIVSIRGGTWKIKFGGDEEPILNEDGDPKPGIELVIVKASPNISKIFYEGAWSEGSIEEPTCYSNDGITPDVSVENPQSVACASCTQNQWGSRITEANKKAKACADSRRVAVTWAHDLENEIMDGPMLLRVPAASLKDLSTYGKAVANKGFPYYSVVSRLSFDPEAAYPKLKYKVVRALTNEEGAVIAAHVGNTEAMDNVLGLNTPMSQPTPKVVEAPAQEESFIDAEFEIPPAEETPAPPKKKAASKKKAAAKKAAPAKEAEGTGASVASEDLDDILGSLDLD